MSAISKLKGAAKGGGTPGDEAKPKKSESPHAEATEGSEGDSKAAPSATRAGGFGSVAFQVHRIKQATKRMRPINDWAEHEVEHVEGDLGEDAVVFLHSYTQGRAETTNEKAYKLSPGEFFRDSEWKGEVGIDERFGKYLDDERLTGWTRYVITFASGTKLFDIAGVIKTELWDICTVHKRVNVVAYSMGGIALGIALLDTYLLSDLMRARVSVVAIETPWLGMHPKTVRWMGDHGWRALLKMCQKGGATVAGTPFSAFQHLDATSMLAQSYAYFDSAETHHIIECISLFSFPAFPDDYPHLFRQEKLAPPYVGLEPSEVRSLALAGMSRLDPKKVLLLCNEPSETAREDKSELFVHGGHPGDLLPGVATVTNTTAEEDEKMDSHHHVIADSLRHLRATNQPSVREAVINFCLS